MGVRHPGRVGVFWGIVCLLGIPGALGLQIDTSTDSVLDRAHPAWQTYQDSQTEFGGDEIIVVSLTGDAPYAADVLAQVEALSDQVAELPGVRRVDSIATVPVIGLDEAGDLDLRAPLEGAPTESTARRAHVEERLSRDRIAPGNLVSEDGRTFAVNLLLERGAEAGHAELLDSLHALVDPTGGLLSGVPVFRVAANERTRAEILAFAPLTALLIAGFLVAVFRRVRVVVIGVIPGVVGSWLLIGAMGFLGAPLSITTMVLPSIILALGCAYSMHFLSAGSDAARDPRSDRAAALETALRRVTLPVALSGLTTVVGFVSITLVRIEAVRATGGYGALGVLVVTAVSLTLVPAMLSAWPLPALAPRGLTTIREAVGPGIVRQVSRRTGLVLAVWAVLAVGVGIGATRIEVETDATRWLPIGHPVRDSYESIREALSGISPMNVVITAQNGESVLEPPTLKIIDRLAAHLHELDEVGKTLSIADPLRQLHGAFADDPTQPLPDSVALSEQYMLLLGSVDQLDDLVTPDRTRANIMIRANDNGSAHLAGVATVVDAWWQAQGPSDFSAVTTGIMYEFARAEDEMAYGQLRGLGVALIVISAVLFAIFRWPRLAALALVPNAIPLALIFGGLGLFGVPLDAGTVIIGALALGVAVDDTIHIATGYYERIQAGDEPVAALEKTFAAVLPAITATTAMISLAFVVFGLSEFTITRNLGLLTGGIMVLCLIADVTLLPALLARTRGRPRKADDPRATVPPARDPATEAGH